MNKLTVRGKIENGRVVRHFRHILESCPAGCHMEYISDSEFMMQQSTDINRWSMQIFEGLKPEDCPIIWKDIERLIREGRTVSMRSGRGEEYPRFFVGAEEHAKEAAIRCEVNPSRGIDDVQISSDP
jgi:hypothetical protein